MTFNLLPRLTLLRGNWNCFSYFNTIRFNSSALSNYVFPSLMHLSFPLRLPLHSILLQYAHRALSLFPLPLFVFFFLILFLTHFFSLFFPPHICSNIFYSTTVFPSFFALFSVVLCIILLYLLFVSYLSVHCFFIFFLSLCVVTSFHFITDS